MGVETKKHEAQGPESCFQLDILQQTYERKNRQRVGQESIPLHIFQVTQMGRNTVVLIFQIPGQVLVSHYVQVLEEPDPRPTSTTKVPLAFRTVLNNVTNGAVEHGFVSGLT